MTPICWLCTAFSKMGSRALNYLKEVTDVRVIEN